MAEVTQGIDANKVYLPSPDQSATTGAVQIAKVGVAKPADARTVMPSNEWGTSLGYIGEDGLTISGVMSAGDKIKEWGGSAVRVTNGDAEPTISIPSIQVDETLAKLIVGDENVKTVDANSDHGRQLEIAFNGKVVEPRAWVFNMKDGNRRIRAFAPNAQVSELDDLQFVPTAANSYALTLSLNVDTAGNFLYLFYDDGKVEAVA